MPRRTRSRRPNRPRRRAARPDVLVESSTPTDYQRVAKGLVVRGLATHAVLGPRPLPREPGRDVAR